jgi:hypothetical protein
MVGEATGRHGFHPPARYGFHLTGVTASDVPLLELGTASAPASSRPRPPRGASLFKIMDVSRHKSVDTLRGYVRDADAFRDHAGAGLL